MTTPVSVIFVALLTLTVVDSTIVSSCLSKNRESMIGVKLSGCEVAPCILQKNTTVTIEITFKPDRDLKQIKHSVHGKMSGITMPFVGVDGTTACKNVFQEDKVTKASCPLAAGTTYVYQYQLRVLPSYPNVNVIIHWGLQDAEQRQDVACPAHKTQDKPIPRGREQVVWLNVVALAYFHLTAAISFVLWRHLLLRQTFLFQTALAFWSGYSVTAGAHRLWAHRAYKAKWPLRLLLAVGHTITFQFDIYEWVRTHRVHHKFTDTDADPHNSKRGFLFSHMGWIMVRKHEDVIVKGRTVDMSDLQRDWVIMWQKRLYLVIGPLCCFVLPTLIPVYFWGEDFWIAWNISVWRFLVTTHLSGLVNSAAHMWGSKPFDQNVSSVDNMTVALLAGGEGWHNYHHAFPWDYKAAELGNYRFNMTTGFLDLCGKLGLAYDFKVASPELIRKRVLRTGDGSHPTHSHEDEIWGWGDEDMTELEKKLVTIINPDKKRNKKQ